MAISLESLPSLCYAWVTTSPTKVSRLETFSKDNANDCRHVPFTTAIQATD
jgi:hypothetical protein